METKEPTLTAALEAEAVLSCKEYEADPSIGIPSDLIMDQVRAAYRDHVTAIKTTTVPTK